MNSQRRYNIGFGITSLILLSLLLGGCYEVGLPASGDTTFAPINPINNMHRQPTFRDQRPQPMYRPDQHEGMRYPPAHTSPIDGFLRDDFTTLEESAQLSNPVPITEDTLDYGKFLYETNCSVCHGIEGDGDGTIVNAGLFGAPPTLNSDALRAGPDGAIYHIITFGQNAMWPYKNNLTKMERWAVVNYIRALQRADLPEPMDLDRMRRQ